MHCGACARDLHLTRGLIERGHDVMLVPLYTPLMRADELPVQPTRVFFGGLNVYLQHVTELFRRSGARWVDGMLDSERVLRTIAGWAIRTEPGKLGPLTVSVLAGKEGRQAREVLKLVRFLREQPAPDVVALTNALLSGVAGPLREALGAPVSCHLQGEDAFLDALPEPHRTEAWALVRANAERVDLFTAPGESYAGRMAGRLGVALERIAVVPPGIDAERFAPRGARPRRPFVVGYLSRITEAKGLDVVAEAVVRLRERAGGEDVRLAIAGQVAERAYWRRVRRRLREAGVPFDYAGQPELAGKLDFLAGLSAFCSGSRCEETRGMAVLEAVAMGVPAVMPAAGIFPELAALAGGALYPVGDAEACAEALAGLLEDPEAADAAGRRGAAAVREKLSHHAMAARLAGVFEGLVAP
jgi:glycosyltransferase involved in cell wall biosynthesis